MNRRWWVRGLLAVFLLTLPLGGVSAHARDKGPGDAATEKLFRSPGKRTYYVDSESGDDGNDGRSQAKAWKSLERVNATRFAVRDKILFKRGSRFSGQLSPKGSGKKRAPIIIDAYGEGARPVIAAEGRYPEALLLKNQEYWEVNHLELTNQGERRERLRYGVHLVAWDYGTVHHIHLKDLFVHDVNGSLIKEDPGEGHGIYWENGGKKVRSRFDGLLIEGCHLLRTDRNGICGYSEHSSRTKWFPSLSVVIRKNLLEDIGGDGIKPWGCDGALVEYNRVHRAGQRCPDYAAGIWPWSCDRTLIQFNEVSEFKGTKDGQGFDSDSNSRDTVFQYNYSHDNEGGFMLICDDGNWRAPESAGNVGTIIRYNISQNDRERTFHISGPIKNVKIYNNAFYVRKGLDIDVFLFTGWHGWSDGVDVYNNIFYLQGTGRYSHGVSRNQDGTYNVEPEFGESKNNVFRCNVYYGHHQDPPHDPRAITADPQLAAPGTGKTGLDSLEGYKLEDGSPCVGAGIPVKNNGGRDFWGNKIPQGKNPDVGAQQR